MYNKQQHSKVAAKSGSYKYQFQTMLSLGIPIEEIHKFADPVYWLYYFPPRAIVNFLKKILLIFFKQKKKIIFINFCKINNNI